MPEMGPGNTPEGLSCSTPIGIPQQTSFPCDVMAQELKYPELTILACPDTSTVENPKKSGDGLPSCLKMLEPKQTTDPSYLARQAKFLPFAIASPRAVPLCPRTS